MDPIVALDDPKYYLNRELSLLQFNLRVLEQSLDESHPLLERMNFLLIFSSNVDEFFEIRVAGLKRQIALGEATRSLDGLLPQEVFSEITEICHQAVTKQYEIFNDVLLPALAKENIVFLKRSQWNEKQVSWIKKFFREQVSPVLTPIGLDPAHPFPRLANKSLNFIVSLEGKDAFGRQLNFAIIPAPRSLPRIIQFPEKISEQEACFTFLSSIIHEHAGALFPGMKVVDCFQFRLTRNADLNLDDQMDSLSDALKGELNSRQFGAAVRLEVAANCPKEQISFLLQQFNLSEQEVYRVNGPVNLARLNAIIEIDRPRLKFPPFKPRISSSFQNKGSYFDAIANGDILLHHPFESFNPVIDFLSQAAKDPNVVAIKQTLYRTDNNSELVKHLIEAARNGKEVSVVIELRARFEEEKNLKLADRLQEAGAVVVYGVVGYKTHAKMMLIIRREKNILKRYIHLSSGNYHTKNARQYTDFSFFSAAEDLCEDVHKLFHELTGMGKVLKLKKMFHAPFTLKTGLIDAIEREITHANEGKASQILLKVNNITEQGIIQALYRASQAGVKTELFVRSICCLKPGIAGVSENIRVRSVVGRFLEHSRVFYFQNNGDPELYCSSADLMERNLLSRIEACFPVCDKKLAARIKKEAFSLYLSDNQQSWQLQQDGSYKKTASSSQTNCAQQTLLDLLTD